MIGRRTILIAHPSPDLYGADLQMLQTVIGLVEADWRVVVVLPGDGDLVARLQSAGAEVRFGRFPVLRKSHASLLGLMRMLVAAAVSVPVGARLIRRLNTSVLLVNTVTLPWWLLAGRVARVPVVAHLHEAETQGRRVIRAGLMAPLRLSDAVIVISAAARESMTAVQPKLAGRTHLIYNGVPQPPYPGADSSWAPPLRVAVVGRLSPRKAPDVALEAVAQLRREGHEIVVEVAGTPFTGYEWYEENLRLRATKPDLAGAVTFSGYCSPIWPVLERADVVLAPSLHEPFGNAVVEAQLARRPVVAAASLGHLETVADGETGLLVPPGDAAAAAAAVLRLIDDPKLAGQLVARAESAAVRRFSVARYRQEMTDVLDQAARGSLSKSDLCPSRSEVKEAPSPLA